ncbi:MAG: hypothetical protein J7539_11220, partial [Niabella sp.]|nr:hypothetical protein [Niabella sp.]
TVIWGGDSSRNVFGTSYPADPSKPESKAYRIMISSNKKQHRNRFLTVFQMTEDTAKQLPVFFKEYKSYYEVRLAGVMQLLSSSRELISDSIALEVPRNGNGYAVVATGISSGFWHIRQKDGPLNTNLYVRPGKNSLYIHLKEGRYSLVPGRSYDGTYFDAPNGQPYILK